jgi:hypothetical protein
MMRRRLTREVNLDASRRAEGGLETKSAICRDLAPAPNTAGGAATAERSVGGRAIWRLSLGLRVARREMKTQILMQAKRLMAS